MRLILLFFGCLILCSSSSFAKNDDWFVYANQVHAKLGTQQSFTKKGKENVLPKLLLTKRCARAVKLNFTLQEPELVNTSSFSETVSNIKGKTSIFLNVSYLYVFSYIYLKHTFW